MAVTVEQAEAVATLLWPEFVDEGGAVFLRSGRLAAAAPLDTFADLVEAECFVNHVHVLDEFEHEAGLDTDPFWNTNHPDFLRAIALAAIVAESWGAALASRFPNREFAVFATRDDNPIVRFHEIRPNLPLWIDPDGLGDLGPGAAFILLVSQGVVTARLGSLAAAR